MHLIFWCSFFFEWNAIIGRGVLDWERGCERGVIGCRYLLRGRGHILCFVELGDARMRSCAHACNGSHTVVVLL